MALTINGVCGACNWLNVTSPIVRRHRGEERTLTTIMTGKLGRIGVINATHRVNLRLMSLPTITHDKQKSTY